MPDEKTDAQQSGGQGFDPKAIIGHIEDLVNAKFQEHANGLQAAVDQLQGELSQAVHTTVGEHTAELADTVSTLQADLAKVRALLPPEDPFPGVPDDFHAFIDLACTQAGLDPRIEQNRALMGRVDGPAREMWLKRHPLAPDAPQSTSLVELQNQIQDAQAKLTLLLGGGTAPASAVAALS